MSDELTLETERQLLRTLLERVGYRVTREHEIESQYGAEDATEKLQYQTAFQLLSENYETERLNLEQTRDRQLAECDHKYQTESATTQAEYQQVFNASEDRFNTEHDAAVKEHDEAVWLVSSLLDDDAEGSPLARLQQARQAHVTIGLELNTRLENLDIGYRAVVLFLRRSHMLTEPVEPEVNVRLSSVDDMKATCLHAIDVSEPLRKFILSRWLPRLFVGIVPVLLFLAIAGGLFAVTWTLVDPRMLKLKMSPTDRDWLYILLGLSTAITLMPVFLLHMMGSQSVWPAFEQLLQHRANANYAYSVWDRMSNTELNMLEAECSHLQDKRVQRRETAIAAAESKKETRTADAQRIRANAIQHAHTTFSAHLNSLEARHNQERERIEKASQVDSQNMIFQRESDFRALQTEHDTRVGEIRRRYQQSWIELIRTWKSDLLQLGQSSDALCQQASDICPPWETLAGDDVPLPQVSPIALSLGRIDVDLESIEGGLSADPRLKADRSHFDVPLLLPMQEMPSLILKATGNGRAAAVRTLQTAMLRYLTSLPPGKVRFTIFDPLGLGANFSAFMYLADVDELLVTSRIWTEPSQIEKRLSDLTEHMETVLQTYLRNEFATIDDYNEFAGEVAEPYRVLVIANFPANFSDVAIRKLASIAEGGRRCGVSILMSLDTSQELPRGFSMADLQKQATVLEWTSGAFRSADRVLADWPLVLEQPPSADLFGRIVRQAGEKSREVRRVEVPFERVAPIDADFWSGDSRSTIEVPVGRAGATKLQYLRLGKGTSQHVLVAGKTGSGKSTLLHALITNLSLHYSPAEIEFYLIDFKKGVEFKVYAEQRLPHARVIAIESDREFGVSVLERLDALLRDRGEQFRAAGAQDIAGFRNARPQAVMPRTLLIIDEFQEFFIEDDPMAQQASLLLDRLIRQGRAFGVHVLLGSQTLSGAYSLARSTLGQVAIRIALQCSDADAHLILNEENTAARLLSRPGEAIYNDANGLIEGNHPFQIVWLGEDEREHYLRLIRKKADRTGEHGPVADAIRNLASGKSVVFEGNLPADLTTCAPLQTLLHDRATVHGTNGTPAAVNSPWTCWLGDSVSLGGPISLSFGQREGGNLLIVGRDEQAALGVMVASALALCTHSQVHGTPQPTIRLLDGSLPDSRPVQTWMQLKSACSDASADSERAATDDNSVIRTFAIRDSTVALNEMIDELHRRGDVPGSPAFLFIYDLARFRELRKADDDYGYGGGFGGNGDKQVTPAQQLTELLRDGPGVGLYTFAWVESYQSAQRWFGREQLNRFEQRVLFAMNANDSAGLVDSPLASRLGDNRALLYRGDLGTLDKFRPFSPPPANWLSRPHDSHSNSATPAENPVPFELTEAIEPTPDGTEQLDELPNIDDLHVQ